MKYVAMLLCSFIVSEATSQNLVPNASFEDYKQLPCELNQFTVQQLLKDWYQPLPTTPDYWNTLAVECFLNPGKMNETTRTGHGMMGVITASTHRGIRNEYKEYVAVKLLERLEEGTLYNVEFYARGIRSQMPYSDILESNNLGAAFSDSMIVFPVSGNNPSHLLLKTAVNEEEIIDDSWRRIGGCFQADSDYQFLLIGNFNAIDSTDLVQLTHNQLGAQAYYFIEDVKVESTPYDLPPLAREVTFCPDQPFVTLDASVDGAVGYEWEDGSTGATLAVSLRESRVYSVNIHFNECAYRHRFYVTYTPDVNLGSDTTLCKGEVLTLMPEHPLKEYVWSDGSLDTIKQISSSGVYTVVVPSGCDIRDSVEVDFIDCPGLSPNIVTPNGDPYNQSLIFANIDSRSWSLEIFNRWGAIVYYSAHYENDWSGDELSDGIYYYRLRSEGMQKVIKGFAQIMHSRSEKGGSL